MHPALTWLAPRALPVPQLVAPVRGDVLIVRTPGGADPPPLSTVWESADGTMPPAAIGAGLARAARAALAAEELSPHQVLCLGSAAWVHIGGPRPRIPDTARAAGRTGRARHKIVLRAHDLTHVDGVPATTPARTVLDLVRRLPFDQSAGPARALLGDRAVAADVRRAVLERTGLPGIRRATGLLDLVLADLGHPPIGDLGRRPVST